MENNPGVYFPSILMQIHSSLADFKPTSLPEGPGVSEGAATLLLFSVSCTCCWYSLNLSCRSIHKNSSVFSSVDLLFTCIDPHVESIENANCKNRIAPVFLFQLHSLEYLESEPSTHPPRTMFSTVLLSCSSCCCSSPP